MTRSLRCVFVGSLLLITSGFVSADVVEVALVDRLNGNQNNYCIDTAGARERAKPEEGLQAYTCYSYQGMIGYDQGMDAEAISNGEFRMTGFDVCMQASSTEAGASIGAQACDGGELQNFNLLPDRSIRLKTANDLCLSVGDDTRFGRGGPTGHQYKDLTLEPCAEAPSAQQQWYLRDKNGHGEISAMSAPGVERSIVRIADRIYRFFNNNHSSLFLLTDDGIVFIDPLNVAASEWLKTEIDSAFGKPVTHLLYSHGHEDHASGGAAFEGAKVISHKNTSDVITPAADESLNPRLAVLDTNSDGVLDADEVKGSRQEQPFTDMDANGDGKVSGYEAGVYEFRDVARPTHVYDGKFTRFEVGGETIEMYFVGGNHSADMSYILFPKQSLVFYVDVISLNALPFGELTWYSEADSHNTYDVALGIEADIAVPSHGPIGTQDDVRALQEYMQVLRSSVAKAIDAGEALEKIQKTLLLEDYSDWDYYEQRRPQNIAGMYRELMREKAN